VFFIAKAISSQLLRMIFMLLINMALTMHGRKVALNAQLSFMLTLVPTKETKKYVICTKRKRQRLHPPPLGQTPKAPVLILKWPG